MKAILLALLLLLPEEPKTKVSVTPRIASEPATVTFLLTGIPEGSRVACFVLDGDGYYASCKELEGQWSYRLEHRNVLSGRYLAGVFIDKKQVSNTIEVIVVGREPWTN